MRLLALTTLTLALLAAAAPTAVSDHGQGIGPVQCDVDDDLYNHCHAGDVHWVTGPGCVGVRVGGQADCDVPTA